MQDSMEGEEMSKSGKVTMLYFCSLTKGGIINVLEQSTEKPLNLRCGLDERQLPEVVGWVLKQLQKCNYQSPGMRAMDDQSFEQDAGDLLPHIRLVGFALDLAEKVKQQITEVVGVAVRVAQVICDRAQEKVSGLRL